MPLNWKVSGIASYPTVCWRADPERPDDPDAKRLNSVTESLIFATIPVGLNQITKGNHEKFFVRLSALESAFGSFLKEVSRDQIVDRSITFDEVKQHIGLSTNAASLTDAQFKRTLADRLMREAGERLRNVKHRTHETKPR